MLVVQVLQFVSPVIIASSLFIAVYVMGGTLTVSKVYHGTSQYIIISMLI